jgi:hypothetical protein
MMEDGRKLTESLRTAQEEYNDNLVFYKTLLDGTAISQQTYWRAIDEAKKKLDEQNESIKRLNSSADGIGRAFTSSFEDAIIEGKRFSSVLDDLAKQIERVLLNSLITEPLGNALSSGIKGFFNPAQTKNVTVSGADYTNSFITASKKGNVLNYGSVIPFASGGVIGGPIMFPMTGGKRGLAGEAGKEAILPLTRTSSGDLGVKASASRTVVNVYAPPGSEVKQDSQQEGGLETISIYIDEAVAGNIGKPGSKTHRSLKNTFGLGQTLTKR